jgi:hypothetical protein
MKKCRSIMTAYMDYEPRTKTAKAVYQEETQEVLVVQTRMRESKNTKNKSKCKTTPANTALRNTTSGLKSGAEQMVRDRNNYTRNDNSNSSKVHDQWNKVGTRSNGGYQSNDN